MNALFVVFLLMTVGGGEAANHDADLSEIQCVEPWSDISGTGKYFLFVPVHDGEDQCDAVADVRNSLRTLTTQP
jgi:hypothetical protein